MIVKISTTSLKPGMYVTNPGLNPHANKGIFLAESEIKDHNEIDAIVGGNFTVTFIDTELGSYFADKPQIKAEIEKLYTLFAEVKYGEEKKRASFDVIIAGLGTAEQQYSKILSQYKSAISKISNNNPLDIAACEDLVRQLIDQHESISLAMTILTQLKRFDDYSYTHSLNVSILATAFGKHLDLGSEELMTLGMAGLFHDIGTIKIPDKILRKPGKLTPGEMAEIQKHPIYGSDLLSRYSRISADVLKIVNEHHEKFMGGGYPKNKYGDKINSKSYMVGIVDTYDSVRSDRVYRKGVNAHKAVSLIFNSRNISYPAFLVDSFVKYIGVYPIGSIVELKNGLKAIVVEQFSDSLLHPIVRVMLDENNRYCEPADVNLFDMSLRSDEYDIVRCLDKSECRLRLKAYLNRTRRQ